MNLQQTEQDGKMSLRMFGRSDDLLRLLLVELADLGVPRLPRAAAAGAGPSARWPTNDCVLVPYDDRGRRLPMGGDDEEEGKKAFSRSKQAKGAQRRMWLDLREGARVRITPGHNIQGARQPGYAACPPLIPPCPASSLRCRQHHRLRHLPPHPPPRSPPPSPPTLSTTLSRTPPGTCTSAPRSPRRSRA